MKYKVLCLALCVAMLAGLIACTQQQIIEEPTPTEKMTPDATIKPTTIQTKTFIIPFL